MSKLEQFQAFIRHNGRKLTGINVPVVLSHQDAKQPQVNFTFGWKIEIGISKHDHGHCCPNGIDAGRSADARAAAHNKAQAYVSGRQSLFNDRFKALLSSDVSSNFTLKDKHLNSAPECYVGTDPCHHCHGSGTNSCYSCGGQGKQGCSACHSSGRVSTQKFDNYSNRTIYSTESCSSCWGSGKKTCSNCGGRGTVTCGTCYGVGCLYCSYSIDGDAKRRTTWAFESADYHDWSESFIKKIGLNIIHSLTDVTEVDAQGSLDGCTFIYALNGQLPTLQFTATIASADTRMCFAGKQNLTHDAGGVYDPAVWSIAKNLASGSQNEDKETLAVPAIKSIIEANESNTKIDLLEENWVSTDIKDAVLSNYQELLSQLRKQSVKGLLPQMLKGVIKYGYCILTLAIMIALLLPNFAADTESRVGLHDYPRVIEHFLFGWYGLFGLPHFANYLFAVAFYWITFKLVKKFYWKRISTFKVASLSFVLVLAIPHFVLSLYFNTQIALQSSAKIGPMLIGGSLFVCLYLLVWGFKLPRKWYLKPLTLILSAAAYLTIQIGLFKLNNTFEFIPTTDKGYVNDMATILQPAFEYVHVNLMEIIVLTLLFTYFKTRRQFCLKAKTAVADYDSPVLLKSMDMVK
ncbi:hypothetical protein [Psychromonas antarctica]|uniref:hypothetical protein n=1 Tax=Psychromonas antarctica TaxID=67573 RepID=UPI001EE90138|nr:hypothetical protein [Psychromonas antarctica]MCG6201435.1 hypothetical protein [Psychromonas antarctica]